MKDDERYWLIFLINCADCKIRLTGVCPDENPYRLQSRWQEGRSTCQPVKHPLSGKHDENKMVDAKVMVKRIKIFLELVKICELINIMTLQSVYISFVTLHFL